MGKLILAGTVIGHPLSLCREIGLALDYAVTIANKLHQSVRKIARRIACRHCNRSRFCQFAHRLLLSFIQSALDICRVIDSFSRCLGLGTRSISCRLCFTPANENQPGFRLQYIFGELAVALCLLRLPP